MQRNGGEERPAPRFSLYSNPPDDPMPDHPTNPSTHAQQLAQQHCERIYLDQAHAKVLNPARFQSSYKNMLRFRPRCRINGLYFLMASYIKRPTRDMWTELKPGTILEVRTTTCGGGGVRRNPPLAIGCVGCRVSVNRSIHTYPRTF